MSEGLGYSDINVLKVPNSTNKNETEVEKYLLNNKMTYHVSWWGYVKLILRRSPILLVLLMPQIAYLTSTSNFMSRIISLILSITPISLYIMYGIYYLRSIRVYADKNGIWEFSGVFPWNKGTRGVKWRDLDEALFRTGFTSWLTESYSVTLKHRFSKQTEIHLTDIYKGDEFVLKINGLHQLIIDEEKNQYRRD